MPDWDQWTKRKVRCWEQIIYICEECGRVHNNQDINLITNLCAWELVPSKDGGVLHTTGRFHGSPMSGNQPCKQPPTSTITLKELQWRDLSDPIPTMNHFLWGVGRAGHWIGKIGDRGSDPQRSVQQTTAVMVTRVHMQAHGKARPCSSPTDHGDC